MTRAPDKLRNYTICNLEAARIIQERGTDAPESLAARWAAMVLENERVVKDCLTTRMLLLESHNTSGAGRDIATQHRGC